MGKIFDPTTHSSFKDFDGFAQSPQVLELMDRIRVYFSIRKRDRTGKYLSHISFVDYDKEFKQIIGVAVEPVIELGKLGTFDEHGIFPINPLQHGDRVYAYTCGWSRRASVSVETATGFAISFDNGVTFEKQGEGPIFCSSLHEPFLVGDSFVRVYNNVFHMWYIYGIKWAKFDDVMSPERIYKIAHAISYDGISWVRDGKQIIADKLNEDECQALPTVIDWNGRYHMYFCYRHVTGFRIGKDRGYRIGYASSDDLVTWVRNDSLAGVDGNGADWDSDMQCYPHVFSSNEKLYLIYNGNEFGKYGFGLAVLEQ